jgi:hypothetical protein
LEFEDVRAGHEGATSTVTISGVGFWDKPHTQNPYALNFAELHPVTAIKFLSGCGA